VVKNPNIHLPPLNPLEISIGLPLAGFYWVGARKGFTAENFGGFQLILSRALVGLLERRNNILDVISRGDALRAETLPGTPKRFIFSV
jgi:hypothetical protein